jgi:hypothetical protein
MITLIMSENFNIRAGCGVIGIRGDPEPNTLCREVIFVCRYGRKTD